MLSQQHQIQAVDKATGVIRVSRKDLLDKETSVPDVIRLLTSTGDVTISTSGKVVNDDSSSGESIRILDPQEIPVFPKHDGIGAIIAPFPATPPRAYSKEFFRFV